MRKKYGIQLRGLGRALRPSGLGTLRPKPTGKGGKPLKPQPIRPGKKDGGMPETDKERQRRLLESVKKTRRKKQGEGKVQEGPRRKLKPVRPDQKGLQSLPKPVRNKMGYMKDGGKVKKFPDLSGDGKVTKKDVLIGRGVIKRKK